MFRRITLGLIRFYQKGISPFTRPSCRFVPTCSAYAYEAVERYGALRGGWLFLKRFGRCHPFGGRGYDPVPEPADERASARSGISGPSGDPLPSDVSTAAGNPVISGTVTPHGNEDSGKARAVS